MNNNINFIPRKFQNITTNEIFDFSDITKIHVSIPLGGTGFESQHRSSISVVLGEPASGKTHQFQYYKDKNKDNVFYKALINVEAEETIEETIKIVLLDSIDEALLNCTNPKILQAKLTNFIKNLQAKNKNIRFVISCRFLEWTEHFENSLKEIDKELRVYNILDISQDDINKIIDVRLIQREEFWNFIEKNYLNFLLKNILVVLKIIENFEKYKTHLINYTDIYTDIIKEHLSVKGNERDEISSDKSLDELILMASSMATYMLLNRKASVSIENLMILSSELYKIQNKSISSNDLKIILNTSLFFKRGNKFSFFHKSIQEYLMACFINYKKLDLNTIKELFSHEFRFYDEFEEVIVYLTNLNSSLFDDLVEFDPFIFKRHPNLNEHQQEKLLSSMLQLVKNNKSMAWGRWNNFNNTTIVRFDNLTDIPKIVENYLKPSDTDKVTFSYLMKLLENNYSYEFEYLVFKYLNEYSKNDEVGNKQEYDQISHSKFVGSRKLRELIEDNFIDNFNFNKSLLYFLIEKYLLNSNQEKISMLDLETKLFESLYGINYINRYGKDKKANVEDTGFDFNELLILLDGIPNRQLEYIVPFLKSEDTLKWLNYLNSKQEKNNYHIVCWCIYAVLKHNDSKEVIEQVFDFLDTNFCYMDTAFDEMSLELESIADNFWEVYFSSDEQKLFRIDNLLKLLKISVDDIKKAVISYPVEDYCEYYVKFRLNQDIDRYLMDNPMFEAYMNAIWEKQKEQQEEWDKELQNKLASSEEYQYRINYQDSVNKICEESLKILISKEDFYNVFSCEKIYEKENQNKLHELMTEDQHHQLLYFIEDDFKQDQFYIEIKKNVNENQYPVFPTARYIYMFQTLNDKKIDEIVQSKEEYEKVFFYAFRFNKINEKFLVTLSSNHFNHFIDSIIELVQLSLQQSQSQDIINLYDIIDVLNQMQRFKQPDLIKLIEYFKLLDNDMFIGIKESYKIEKILDVLLLDEQSYDFIDSLRKYDSDRSSLYMGYLIDINPKKALDSYFLEYQKESIYIKCYKLKKFFGIKIKDEKDKHRYDKPNIYQSKIKFLKNLISSLIKNKNIDILEDRYIAIILNDYYDFFYEYERPTGSYSPNTYDDMYEYIGYLWNSLGATDSYISLLQDLTKKQNDRLLDTAKYYLEQAYNHQNKERNFSNSYYKEILDQGEEVSGKVIHNYGLYVEGDNNGTMNQNTNIANSSASPEKWYQNWLLLSGFISLISGGLIWWSISSLIFAFIGMIIVFLILLSFNPKRRFFRIAWSCLVIGGAQFIPYSGLVTIPRNKFIYGYLEIGNINFPWIGLVMILGAFYLFWLDKNEK